ncbi:hypothetical protein KC19_3G252800 [Ceratodon purpureus]|uniref:Uncharacterized protein n=1 Tax=Ceratodon purpureus TaxID=3225 RepID=A0A8T0IQZ0_CERPU|nr:hypothetical protein KC19_3G252800 [Ceratodon purpureus]
MSLGMSQRLSTYTKILSLFLWGLVTESDVLRPLTQWPPSCEWIAFFICELIPFGS